MGILRSFLRRRSRSSTLPASPSSPAKELERVFNKFDSNGDGKISSSELASIFESLGHPASPEDLAEMMEAADEDGDGFISLDEFVDLNTARVDPATALEDLRHAFSVFDLDQNGLISADELARVLRSLGEAATVGQCRKMIKGVDQNGDGMICFEEFKIMMQGSGIAAAVTANNKN